MGGHCTGGGVDWSGGYGVRGFFRKAGTEVAGGEHEGGTGGGAADDGVEPMAGRPGSAGGVMLGG